MTQLRKLAAIMFTDIVGYSALMSKDEKQAMHILEKNRKIHKSAIAKFNGEYIKEIGDGNMSIFQSSFDAVSCAIEIQKACCKEPSLMIRIGIHIGDIILKENDVFGDGVNIASRIEAASGPGGIYLSGRVYEDIKNKTDIKTKFIGEKQFKNISHPVKIYSVITRQQETVLSKPKHKKQEKIKPKLIIVISAIILIGIAIIIALIVFNKVYDRKNQKDITMLEKSIAVLPLKNWSQDEEYSYLGDAIADEIIMQLINIKEIRVLSLTSTLQYKDNPKPIPLIAEELGVNYIIEGGIQRHNNNLSIRVQFIRANNEDHLWGEEYDGEWKDIFYIQDEIAKQVARQLQTVLSPEEIGQIEKEPTENFEAYRLYLKGQSLRQKTEPNILKAIYYFKQAILKDSTFALAYSGLASSYCMLLWYAPPSMDVYPKAKKTALKALELDNNLAEAYASLGFVNLINWEWKAAEDNYKNAIKLNPNHFYFHVQYGLILTYTGQLEKAVEEMKKGCLLDPLSAGAINNLGMAYITDRKYDEVIKVTEEVLNVFSIKDLHTYLGQAYLYKGLYDKALAVFKKQENDIWTGITYSLMGETNKANQVLTEILKKSESEYISPFLLSLLYFSLSQEDQGFRLMEKAYDDHDLELTEIKTYPLLDIIRSDPRYLEILRKMGLE